jgi:hypothetical protein
MAVCYEMAIFGHLCSGPIVEPMPAGPDERVPYIGCQSSQHGYVSGGKGRQCNLIESAAVELPGADRSLNQMHGYRTCEKKRKCSPGPRQQEKNGFQK